MAAPIEDASKLPGQPVRDQEGQEIGKVKDVYRVEEEPMWVTVEASTGLFGERLVFIPLARLKEEDGEVRVPYGAQRIKDSPEVQDGDELSPEDDRRLRDYYAIDQGDQEVRTDNESYAARSRGRGAGNVECACASRSPLENGTRAGDSPVGAVRRAPSRGLIFPYPLRCAHAESGDAKHATWADPSGRARGACDPDR
jgi:sporulation protein YlmC with PRC-barrel domain